MVMICKFLFLIYSFRYRWMLLPEHLCIWYL